jgi:ABC-2 type transport system permease protein
MPHDTIAPGGADAYDTRGGQDGRGTGDDVYRVRVSPRVVSARAAQEALLRTAVLIRHNTTLLLRDPGPLIGRIVMPVVLLLVVRPLYQEAQGPAEGTAQAVVGPLVMFSLLAMSIVGTSILSERTWRTWDRLRSTPVRPLELMAGKAVPVFGVLAVQQAVVLGFGVVVLGMPVAAPALLLAACAAWGLTLLGLGAAIGVLVRGHGQLSAVFDIGAFLLTALGGALVPLAVLPAWVRDIAPVSPGYWASDALRHAAAGDTARTLAGIGVLLAVAAVAGAVAAWRIGHGWGRAIAV